MGLTASKPRVPGFDYDYVSPTGGQ